ncbi:Expansin-B7 [Dichanthelium oligosanthes]|uniref:Expansin-B7 n=1 Tax=Dichanthelium oligosanthes TaxID=888268 RepID=A0A1E5WLT0_9POAL|nr:Expansin-B7 [Dichanthelium oligosanthes]
MAAQGEGRPGKEMASRAVAAALLLLCLVAVLVSCVKYKSHKAPPSDSNSPSGSGSSYPSGGYPSGNGTTAGGESPGGWLNARATWYGAPNGAGPPDNGGACGFKRVNLPPFSAMTSCGNQPLFKDGKGCGSCYQVRCFAHPACSGVPETVIITDMNYYPVALYHFDLSGTAFGAMAMGGRNDELRHAGIIDIQFKRVPCRYPGLTVAFNVEHGSNPNYLAVLVEYEDGDGDVVQVDLMESRAEGGGGGPTGVWEPMRESWGSIWRMDTRRPLRGPFSLRITNESGRTLVAEQVIPADWRPNNVYRSIVQFG